MFQKSPDEKPGISSEDRTFLRLMNSEFTKDCEGYWTAPLPFRSDKPKLPDNQVQALKRAKSLHISMQKDPLKTEHMFTLMEGILENGHAVVAPPIHRDKERWYLLMIGVYHPKKPNQIRGVFDSSAEHCVVSLNPVLLMTDVWQMFYCVRVKDEHKDYVFSDTTVITLRENLSIIECVFMFFGTVRLRLWLLMD